MALAGGYSVVSARAAPVRTSGSWELAINAEPEAPPWTSWIRSPIILTPTRVLEALAYGSTKPQASPGSDSLAGTPAGNCT